MEDKTFVCCMCGGLFSGYGNNPDGAAWKTEDGKIELPEFKDSERCCDECNMKFVIPGRLYRMNLNKNK